MKTSVTVLIVKTVQTYLTHHVKDFIWPNLGDFIWKDCLKKLNCCL